MLQTAHAKSILLNQQSNETSLCDFNNKFIFCTDEDYSNSFFFLALMLVSCEWMIKFQAENSLKRQIHTLQKLIVDPGVVDMPMPVIQ